MATPQGGVFTEGTSFYHYLEYDVSDGFDAAAIGKVLVGKGSANAVVTFGNGLWQKFSSVAPEALGDFTAIDGTQSLNSPATEHDLLLWFHAATYDDVIGLTKPDSIGLEGEAMPPDSYVSRTDVKLDGTTLKIYRLSALFGGAGEKGLYFIAFSCDPMGFDVMLQPMFGTSNNDLHDQLIHYSTPVTGSYWSAPSEEDLAAAGCTG